MHWHVEGKVCCSRCFQYSWFRTYVEEQAYLLSGCVASLFTILSASSRCREKKWRFATSCFGSMNLHVPKLVV